MPRLKMESLWTSSETCTASSRVGQRMSTCTARRLGSVFSMAGMANAAVLPEPVCDWPTTSRPLISTGMASAWMGAAFSKPIFSTAFNTSGERPSSENNFGVISICLYDFAQNKRVRFELRAKSCRGPPAKTQRSVAANCFGKLRHGALPAHANQFQNGGGRAGNSRRRNHARLRQAGRAFLRGGDYQDGRAG